MSDMFGPRPFSSRKASIVTLSPILFTAPGLARPFFACACEDGERKLAPLAIRLFPRPLLSFKGLGGTLWEFDWESRFRPMSRVAF